MLQFKPLGTMCSNSNQVNSEQLKVSLQSKTGQTKLANKWLIRLRSTWEQQFVLSVFALVIIEYYISTRGVLVCKFN